MHEIEGTIPHTGQEDQLQESLKKGLATYRLVRQVAVEGFFSAEASVDLLHQLLLVHLGLGWLHLHL